jgi:glycerol uptake facilitator-like aquaporin
MSYRPYVAEMLGTFVLTFVVWLSVAFAMPFSTPIMAALTLGLFVYLVGPISGAHLNPSVTIGLLAIQKIKPRDAGYYVIAQFIGAIVALILGTMLNPEPVSIPMETDLLVGAAEMLGTAILAFCVTAATIEAVKPSLSGVVVGTGLFIGIYLAFPFSNAVLNPAVALGIGSLGSMYILGPLVGGVIGAWAAKGLLEPHRGAKRA